MGLIFALATVGCGPAPSKKPLTVTEVLEQIDRLNGKTVSVFGYIPRCEALSCMLHRNKAESDDVDRAMSVIRAAIAAGATDTSSFPFPSHPYLGIGVGTPFTFFDLRASLLYADSYVVITGKVSNECRSKGHVCFDRAADLEPTDIRAAPPLP
jgi:hypothetical protein